VARTFHMTHQSLSKSCPGFRIDTIFCQWVPTGRCRDRESTTGKKTVRVQGTASLGAWLDRTDRERTCGTRCSPASFHIASSLCDQGVPTVDTAGNSKWIFVSVSARARTDVDSTSLPSEIDRSAQSRTHCCLIYRSVARPPTITASVSVFQTSGAGKNLVLLRRRPSSRGAVSFKLQLIFLRRVPPATSKLDCVVPSRMRWTVWVLCPSACLCVYKHTYLCLLFVFLCRGWCCRRKI